MSETICPMCEQQTPLAPGDEQICAQCKTSFPTPKPKAIPPADSMPAPAPAAVEIAGSRASAPAASLAKPKRWPLLLAIGSPLLWWLYAWGAGSETAMVFTPAFILAAFIASIAAFRRRESELRTLGIVGVILFGVGLLFSAFALNLLSRIGG